MEQSPSCEASRFLVDQEIPRIVWNPEVHCQFKNARHLSLSWSSSIQSILPHPTSWRSILAFPNKNFYSFFRALPIYVSHSQTINLLGHCRRILSNQRPCVTFCNIIFYGMGLISAPPSLFVKSHHLSAVCGHLFNTCIFALSKTHTL
jgi:hypothetical protein